MTSGFLVVPDHSAAADNQLRLQMDFSCQGKYAAGKKRELETIVFFHDMVQ